MGSRSVIMMTTAVAGSGKSYLRCARFLVDDFLPNTEGVHWSNFPVHRERVAAAVAKKTEQAEVDILERIQIIPEDVLDTWRQGKSGPWEFFKDKDINHAHIAFDEFHKFCSVTSGRKIVQKYQEWFGEIRHRGATVEMISQSPTKIPKQIQAEAGQRLQLVNSETRRDPFLKIPLADWYELRAGLLTRSYEAKVWVLEKREVDGRWVTEHQQTFLLDPYYFDFYDSYNAPESGTIKGQAAKREWEKRGRIGLIFWFIRRNFFGLAKFFGFALLIYLLISGNLFPLMMKMFMPSAGKPQPAAVVQKPAVTTRPATTQRRATTRSASRAPVSPELADLPPEARERFKAMQTELSAMSQRQQELERRLDEYSTVVLIADDGATFKDGTFYGVGDVIEMGRFKGRKVKNVSLVRGRVLLDDGTILRLGGVRPEGANDAPSSAGTALAGRVPPAPTTQPGYPAGNNQVAPAHYPLGGVHDR